MTARSVTHATFAVERSYPASPERVFAAFATPEAKSRWFGAPADMLAEIPASTSGPAATSASSPSSPARPTSTVQSSTTSCPASAL